MYYKTDDSRLPVYVATDAELLSDHYYRRLWMAVRNIGISRRDWLDELSDAFLEADARVRIIYRSGDPYRLPEIDEVFPCPEMRWLSDYLKSDPSGLKPASRSRAVERLRLLDLFFRVKHPQIAAHFAR